MATENEFAVNFAIFKVWRDFRTALQTTNEQIKVKHYVHGET